ncbi:MAG TPA: hypothetical protein VG273_03885 [Bryobacteraceae bacterium]|nr:hypothetical protein [Bryobacteraceae bacterium]
MLLKAGQLFRLTVDIIAIRPVGDRLGVVIIPGGSLVLVEKFPCDDDDRMADASWDGEPVAVFGRDLFERGEEIKDLNN